MEIKAFYDEATYTLTYVVYDPTTKDAVVIDPVLDFEPLTWRVHTGSVRKLRDFVAELKLEVHWILDTHAHADHLSGMAALKALIGGKTAIGAKITEVQQVFTKAYNLEKEVPSDGQQWDTLLQDGEELRAGALTVKAIHTPGHTPACMSYLIGDALFTGDALFMPDYGTGRCDFPKGSADNLYSSIVDTLYRLPPETRVFVGHDYQPGGRELRYETTIGASMESNVQLPAARSRADFVAMRSKRDAGLAPPKLILQSLQVNIRAGELPSAEDNDRQYFKMPVNFLGS